MRQEGDKKVVREMGREREGRNGGEEDRKKGERKETEYIGGENDDGKMSASTWTIGYLTLE